MAYIKTQWVNDVTPIDATNMNKIEDELETLDNGAHAHANKSVLDGIESAHIAQWNGKSVVSASDTGSSTTEAHYLTVNGTEWKLAAGGGGGSAIKLGTITTSATWTGTGPFTQTVTVTGVTITENSKVDLQPDAETLMQMADDGCSILYVTNNAGVLTLTAIGGFLSVAKTIQVTVTETITEA